MLSLILLAALSQNWDSVGSGRRPLGLSQYQRISSAETTAALTLYVDSTGNDNNACTGTGADACLTIMGALDKVPKVVKHAVSITVGAGNFAGGVIDGFDIRSSGSLVIQGTMSTVTPTTGSATGTFTGGVTNGTANSTTWATGTVTGAGWTVNDFRGKWCLITSGTGAGQARLIASNTATTLTYVGTWSTNPVGASGFSIVEPGTVLNANYTYAGFDGTGAYTATLHIGRNLVAGQRSTGASSSSRLVISQFSFTAAPSLGQIQFYADGTGVSVQRTKHSSNAISVGGSPGLFTLRESLQTSGTAFIASSNGSNSLITNSMFSGTGGAASVGDSSVTQMVTSYLYGVTTGIALATYSNASVILTGVQIDCNSSGGYGIKNSASGGAAGISLRVTSSSISNCDVAVGLTGAMTAGLIAVTGTGNTTGTSLASGARVYVSSATTLTGTSEIVIDGAAATDLATLRAATPKVLNNTTTFSAIYEP